MITHLEHIAVKVSEITPISRALEHLGLECSQIEEHDEVGMKIAYLGNRETRIELLEVTDKQSPIAMDPAGLHHLALKVDNIDELFSRMKNDDRYILDGDIRKGAHSRIFFFRIKGQEEILFECVE